MSNRNFLLLFLRRVVRIDIEGKYLPSFHFPKFFYQHLGDHFCIQISRRGPAHVVHYSNRVRNAPWLGLNTNKFEFNWMTFFTCMNVGIDPVDIFLHESLTLLVEYLCMDFCIAIEPE